MSTDRLNYIIDELNKAERSLKAPHHPDIMGAVDYINNSKRMISELINQRKVVNEWVEKYKTNA